MSQSEQEIARSGSAIIDGFASRLLEAHSAGGSTDPLVIGLCGAQGIGKSTLARAVADDLQRQGWRVLLLSLDDLYLTRFERQRLARDVHPLLATRGVPGTHDVALGLRVLEAAGKPGRVAVPRFDKAQDDRAHRDEWPIVQTPVDLVLFEGWCVGAMPQAQDALSAPVNALEKLEDADGLWRGYANAQLAGPYRMLFDQLDALVLLAAPGFEVVAGWRAEQEQELPGGPVMTGGEIDRFVQHYERLTRHILDEMPTRADLVLTLDPQRRIVDQATRSPGSSPAK